MNRGEFPDWDHVYILGWEEPGGKSSMSSYILSKGTVVVDVVVIGAARPPGWNAPVPDGCSIEWMPEQFVTTEERVAYATSRGGLYAYGILTDVRIDRSPKDGK